MAAVKKTGSDQWLCSTCLQPLEIAFANVPKDCATCAISPASPTIRQVGANGGPGTELKKLLAKIGIVATPTCRCNSRAAVMDENERKTPGWCEENIDTIVGWLREEAANRGLPFLDAAGRVLVRRAIRNAKNIS